MSGLYRALAGLRLPGRTPLCGYSRATRKVRLSFSRFQLRSQFSANRSGISAAVQILMWELTTLGLAGPFGHSRFRSRRVICVSQTLHEPQFDNGQASASGQEVRHLRNEAAVLGDLIAF